MNVARPLTYVGNLQYKVETQQRGPTASAPMEELDARARLPLVLSKVLPGARSRVSNRFAGAFTGAGGECIRPRRLGGVLQSPDAAAQPITGALADSPQTAGTCALAGATGSAKAIDAERAGGI